MSHIDHETIRGQRYHTAVEFHKDHEKVDKMNGKGGELSFSNIPLRKLLREQNKVCGPSQ